MFQVHSWPNVILHLDGDAFFASVIQATRPYLRDKPVVTGRERGIATAVSYQAKKLGITRGMRVWEIKKRFQPVSSSTRTMKSTIFFPARCLR